MVVTEHEWTFTAELFKENDSVTTSSFIFERSQFNRSSHFAYWWLSNHLVFWISKFPIHLVPNIYIFAICAVFWHSLDLLFLFFLILICSLVLILWNLKDFDKKLQKIFKFLCNLRLSFELSKIFLAKDEYNVWGFYKCVLK